jgi:hypothetical protein
MLRSRRTVDLLFSLLTSGAADPEERIVVLQVRYTPVARAPHVSLTSTGARAGGKATTGRQ